MRLKSEELNNPKIGLKICSLDCVRQCPRKYDHKGFVERRKL